MRDGDYALWTIFFSHGLTAALTVYLAVRGGDWLDRKLGTAPWLMLVLVLLVVGANVRLFIKDITTALDQGSSPPGRGRGGGSPRGDGGKNKGRGSEAGEGEED